MGERAGAKMLSCEVDRPGDNQAHSWGRWSFFAFTQELRKIAVNFK
jgi:hypothetical protein